MLILLIVYLIIALIVFIGILVESELTTTDFIKRIARASGKSYINYKRAVLVSLFWVFVLLFILIMIIVAIIVNMVQSKKSN